MFNGKRGSTKTSWVSFYLSVRLNETLCTIQSWEQGQFSSYGDNVYIEDKRRVTDKERVVVIAIGQK